MTPQELVEKLQIEKRARKNTERRAKYREEKIRLEMIEFEEGQSRDFAEIFANVPRDDIGEEMKIFWEAQEMALKSKGTSGCRWHPK